MTDETSVALERLKQVSEISMSSFISQVMHESVPTIHQLADSLEKAKAQPVEALEMLKNLVDQKAQDADQMSMEIEQRSTLIRRAKNANDD